MISKEIKFLLTHSSIYGLGTVTSRLVAFLLLPLYTRYLTPKDYGILELIDITTGTIALVVSLGIIRSMSRFYYDEKDLNNRNIVVSTSYVVYASIAILCSFFLFSFTDFIAEISLKSRSYGNFFTISFISMLLGGLIDIGVMYLRLIKKSYIYISITISRLFILIFLNILLIAHFRMGVLGILYSSLITRTLFSVIITTAIVYRTGLVFSLKLARDLLKFSLPLIPANILNWLVNKSDRYFILYYISVGDTGIYALAQKLGSAIHSLITRSFLMTFGPRRFEIINRNPENTPHILNKIFTYYTFIMVFIGLSLSVLVPEILRLMTTPKFYAAGPLVPLVVLSMVIFGLRYHFEFGILWSKKTQYYAYINGLTSFINVGLNFLLIPNFGIWGAVFASLIAITIHSILLYLISNRLYPIPFEFFRVLKMFSLACFFFAISIFISTSSIFIDIALKIGLILGFSATLVGLNIFTQEEKSKLRDMLSDTILKITSRIKPITIDRRP